MLNRGEWPIMVLCGVQGGLAYCSLNVVCRVDEVVFGWWVSSLFRLTFSLKVGLDKSVEEARTCDFSLLVLTIVKWRVIVDGFGVLGDYFNIKQNQVIPRLDRSV
ncbi:hypothetical protein V6Z11_D07G203700 [Gossypium hirsutum]